ncbi:MAG TPA: DsbA family protein [Longimicrobiales bacterium]|nr:DsbA family protein [Longimicrobiales bacterium]
MNRAVIVIAAVLVVAIGAFAVNMSSGAPAGTATAPVEFDGMDDMNTLANLAQPAVQGNPEARIRIIEFGDYGCPACAGFYSTVKPQIELAYGDNEDVAFVYYDFPILQAHPHAFVAARAARCAGDQNMYWEYHGQLFENQRSWSLAASTPLGELESYAAAIGANEDQFSSCLRSDAYADVVTANLELARNLGVSGTPTVMVADGSGSAQRMGNDFASIQQAVGAALQGGESGDEGGR